MLCYVIYICIYIHSFQNNILHSTIHIHSMILASETYKLNMYWYTSSYASCNLFKTRLILCDTLLKTLALRKYLKKYLKCCVTFWKIYLLSSNFAWLIFTSFLCFHIFHLVCSIMKLQSAEEHFVPWLHHN